MRSEILKTKLTGPNSATDDDWTFIIALADIPLPSRPYPTLTGPAWS